MNSPAHSLNLVAAWAGILLGFVSGLALGLFFHREDWLGGYASFKRRLYRLAHISLFGLGAVNLLFWLTVENFSGAGSPVSFASWLFVLGAITMPVCCVAVAHWPRARNLFAVPVLSLVAAGGLTLVAVGRSSMFNDQSRATNYAIPSLGSSACTDSFGATAPKRSEGRRFSTPRSVAPKRSESGSTLNQP